MPSYYVAFGSRTRGRKRGSGSKSTFKWQTFDKKYNKHEEDSKKHVLTYVMHRGKGYTKCSDPDCVINKAWGGRDESVECESIYREKQNGGVKPELHAARANKRARVV